MRRADEPTGAEKNDGGGESKGHRLTCGTANRRLSDTGAGQWLILLSVRTNQSIDRKWSMLRLYRGGGRRFGGGGSILTLSFLVVHRVIVCFDELDRFLIVCSVGSCVWLVCFVAVR